MDLRLAWLALFGYCYITWLVFSWFHITQWDIIFPIVLKIPIKKKTIRFHQNVQSLITKLLPDFRLIDRTTLTALLTVDLLIIGLVYSRSERCISYNCYLLLYCGFGLPSTAAFGIVPTELMYCRIFDTVLLVWIWDVCAFFFLFGAKYYIIPFNHCRIIRRY